MARLFRPERVEYDVLVAAPSSDETAGDWTTTTVDSVRPDPLSGAELLHSYVIALLPRLRDFAEHIAAPSGDAAPSQRYGAYQGVRAMVRGRDGEALAELRADGRVLLPPELDSELRGKLIGLVNVGLPMVTRSIDQGSYENALATLVKARGVVNAMLQAVLNMAVSGPEPLSREQLAAALRVKPSDLDSWYAGRTTG